MLSIEDLLISEKRPLVIAHRGASFYYRENTMEAFEAAVEMRAEMIELDVHRTKDGVLVVHHDHDFNNIEIIDMTINQMKAESESAGYIVPTLIEVLKLCKGKVPLDIELKQYGCEDQLLQTVLGILEPEQFLVSSSYDAAVLNVKMLNPKIRTGLILYRAPFPGFLRHLFPAARVRLTGVDILMVSEKLIKLGFWKLNKDLRKPVWVYTVNDRKRMWKLVADERVGGIFTDRPDVALFLRDLYKINRNSEFTLRPGSGQGIQEPE